MFNPRADPFQAEDQFLGMFGQAMSASGAAPVAAPHDRAHVEDGFDEDQFAARQAFLELALSPDDVAAAASQPRAGASVPPRTVSQAPVQVLDWDTVAAAMADGTYVPEGMHGVPLPHPAAAATRPPAQATPEASRKSRTADVRRRRTASDAALETSSRPEEHTAKPAEHVATETPQPAFVDEPAPKPTHVVATEGESFELLQVRLRHENESSRLAKKQADAAKKQQKQSAKVRREDPRQAHGQRRRHRAQRALGGDSSEEEPEAPRDEAETPPETSLPDYNPEEGGPLLEKVRRRQARGSLVGSGKDGEAAAAIAAAETWIAGEDEYVRMPYAFQQGPVPYWLRRASELLFTQNTLGVHGAGSGELPVDTVLQQLRADLREAQKLLVEVGGPEGGQPMRRRAAPVEEQYDGHTHPYASAVPDAPAPVDAARVDNDDHEEEMDRRSASASATAVTAVDGNVHKAAERVVGAALPLLDTAAEAADRRRPVLAQKIPLWRYHGAARAALTELVDLLHSRIALLEARVDEDQDALAALGKRCQGPLGQPRDGTPGDDDLSTNVPWRTDALSLPRQFAALGGPGSDGVDGRQAIALPPAVAHAHATTVAATLMSDLFNDPASSAFSDRAVRLTDAFYSQIPAIHARYLIDEGARPVYDPARTLQPPCALASGGDDGQHNPARGNLREHRDNGATDPHQSYSVHVDYVRFHPAKSYMDVEKVLLGRGASSATATATPPSGAKDTVAEASGRAAARESRRAGVGTPLFYNNNGSFASSLLTDLDRALPTAATGPLSASVSWLLVQALAVSAATRLSPIPFSLESFFVAHLLHHYEQYRLLVLNLHPDIKSRVFYTEQVTQLEAVKQKLVRGEMDKAVLVEDVEPLLQQLWQLCETASRWEKHHLKRMVEMWNMILIVRGQPPLPCAPDKAQTQRRRDSGSQLRRGAPVASLSSSSSAAASSSWPWRTSGGADEPPGAAPAPGERLTSLDAPGVFASSEDTSISSAFTPPQPGSADSTAASHAYPSGALFDSPTPWRHTVGGRPPLERNTAQQSLLFSTSGTVADGDDAITAGGEVPSRRDRTDGVDGFRFYLLPHDGRREPLGHVPDPDDLLDFFPVVEGVDTTHRAATAAHAEAEALVGWDGEKGRSSVSLSAPAGSPASLSALRFFQVAVFVRSSAAMPPQYVGSTMPRPLTATNTLFFNETFELRALQEPQEVLLHILPVAQTPTRRRRVLATVRVQPTLARRYRLFPLEPPVSFVLRGQLVARADDDGCGEEGTDGAGHGTASARAPVSGVLAGSTTWTSWRGLTLEQVEQVFLRRQADPLDPAHIPVLRQLRSYYAEIARNRREVRLAEAQSRRACERAAHRHRRMAVSLPPPPPPRRAGSDTSDQGNGQVRRRGSSGSSARHLNARAGTLLGQPRTASVVDLSSLREANRRRQRGDSRRSSSRAGSRRGHHSSRGNQLLRDEDMYTDVAYDADRLDCLRRRWLVVTQRSAVESEMEARLYRYPIPLCHSDARELVKFVQRELALEARERQRSYRHLDLDEATYHAGPSSTSGLALSPLPKSVKRQLWQKRLAMSKLTRKAARDVSDAEKLAAVVTIPKFSLRLAPPKPPRSRLNPERKERPKTEAIDRDTFSKSSRLVFHIMKAMNLPRRADGSPLEPFVEVGFVYETAYSRCELGTSPSWFQTLELPFEPPSLDEDTLNMIDDDLFIAIYDKVEVPMPSTPHGVGVVAHETHYRTERRLLGTLRIPFYSLHKAESARMEGVFPLQVPRWLLGYRTNGAVEASRQMAAGEATVVGAAAALRDQQGNEVLPNPFTQRGPGGGGDMNSEAGPSGLTEAAATDGDMAELHATTATIQLYISLWPPLQRDKKAKVSEATLVRRVHDLNVSAGLRMLHDVALKWRKTAISRIKSIAAMNPLANDRAIEPFVFCSTGDLMLACRYLLPRGGPPPPSVTSPYEAIRFVSLLPFVTDVMTWGDKDVWSTNAELLAERAGDYEELALLLVHFLRHLAPARATYVVVGTGEIFEQTIMVLHDLGTTSPQRVLIDPRTGWISPVEAPYATVFKDVHVVISHNQLWANLQLSGLPHRMNWDFTRRQYWLPCFTVPGGDTWLCADPQHLPARQHFDAVISPIQRVNLDFTAPDPARAVEIEMELRNALHKALTAWRHQAVPTYHRGVEGVLVELLKAAEDERCRAGSSRDPAVSALAEEKLQAWFGEPIVLSARATRRVSADADGGEGRGAMGDRDDGGRRQERTCLHLVGAPAMSSYNPRDVLFHHLTQQVFETAVHEVGTDDVSFAIGVHVKSYTADVFSMWAFVAAVYRGVQVVHVDDEVRA